MISRKRVGITSLVAMLLVAAFASLSAVAQTNFPEPGDDATELLTSAAQTMQTLDSYRFTLHYEKGKTTIYDHVKVTKVDGTIVRPDRLDATVEAKVSRVPFDLSLKSESGRIWVDAVGIDGEIGIGSDLETLLADPTRHLLDVAAAVEQPIVREIESSESGPIIWITGKFDPSRIPESALGSFTNDLGRQEVDIAIDEAFRIVSIRFPGPFASYDSDDVIRRLDFYDFNQVKPKD